MYNSLAQLPNAGYRILEYLALSPSAENIWKMLKYASYDALSKPTLTFDEKMALVWRDGKMEDYNVFFTPLIDDAICESKCIFKIYNSHIHAEPNLYLSTPVFAFELLHGATMAMVECNGIPVNRGDLFYNEILSTLNGKEIGGIGKFVFSDDLSNYCLAQTVVGNQKTFTGKCIYIATLMGDSGEENCCGS